MEWLKKKNQKNAWENTVTQTIERILWCQECQGRKVPKKRVVINMECYSKVKGSDDYMTKQLVQWVKELEDIIQL